MLIGIAAFFVVIKLAYILFAGPIADEAYYWVWGQRFGLSYFDHPPFNAWMLGLADALFGTSLLSLRALTLLTMLGTFYLYHLWFKRVAGAQWQDLFWPAVVIYLASPTFGFFTSFAQHDYMLVFLALVSGHFFLRFLVEERENRNGRLLDLYLGAVFLGLLGLTKYSGVLFGLGLLVYLVLSPRLRRLFRSPHLYAAAALAILMQAPILIWAWQTDFASFTFHLSGRHPEGWLNRIIWVAFAEFVLVSLLLISPFLAVGFARFLLSRPATGFERTAQGLGTAVFWVSSLLFLAISLFDRVWWWWNLLAYVLLIPFAARYLGRGWLFWGHVALGAFLQLYLLISSTVLPLSLLVGIDDVVRKPLFGWEQLREPVTAAREQYRPGFVATMTSEVAGVLAFALDDPEVTALTPAPNQFDYWFAPETHRGEDALIVLRDNNGEEFLRQQFGSLSPISEIVVERFGYRLGTYQVLLGRDFRPAAP